MIKKIWLLSLVSCAGLGAVFAQSGEIEILDPRLLQQQWEATQKSWSQAAVLIPQPAIALSGAENGKILDPWLLQQQLNAQNQRYDYYSDDSYQRFLDPTHPFTIKSYEPVDLVAIDSNFTFNNAKIFQLRKEVAEQFGHLVWHFAQENPKKKISITSAYRSFKLQTLLSSKCDPTHCAAPGTSEHQAGLAVDIGINGRRLDKNSSSRLRQNAHRRGFHQTYQKGVAIDGKIIEPRHWRYLGVELATELHEKNMSFAQRFKQEEESKALGI